MQMLLAVQVLKAIPFFWIKKLAREKLQRQQQDIKATNMSCKAVRLLFWDKGFKTLFQVNLRQK
jgi:hypothetical protein